MKINSPIQACKKRKKIEPVTIDGGELDFGFFGPSQGVLKLAELVGRILTKQDEIIEHINKKL